MASSSVEQTGIAGLVRRASEYKARFPNGANWTLEQWHDLQFLRLYVAFMDARDEDARSDLDTGGYESQSAPGA